LNDIKDLIQIGQIVGAHGIRGAVKVHSFSDSTDCFNKCSDLMIINAHGRRLDHRIEWARPHQKGLRLGIEDMTTRNQAETLVGCGIFIARTCLPPLDPDTNYWVDLIGMAVYTTDDEYIGRICDIIPTGANDVYVVDTPEGYAIDEILLPAIASVVIEVDVPGRRMRVNMPEGLA
jgi:16S rRNA processing protein RimM